MLTLAQAMRRRGASGVPLPDVFPSLAARGARFRQGELALIIGPPSAGKSLIIYVLLARLAMPGLAFLLDATELEATAKFASILTGERLLDVQDKVMAGDESYAELLAGALPDLHSCFYAPSHSDTLDQLAAFEQRYGMPPPLMALDNMGNQTSGMGEEWALLKALSLELSLMAQSESMAVVAAHHTTDVSTMEPLARDKALGKISQYARLMLSVSFNAATSEYKVAIVKNRWGESDPAALRPVTMWADPARMAITDNPQVAYAWRQQTQLASRAPEGAELRSSTRFGGSY